MESGIRLDVSAVFFVLTGVGARIEAKPIHPNFQVAHDADRDPEQLMMVYACRITTHGHPSCVEVAHWRWVPLDVTLQA